jgi:iron(III) transport system substrate-binding protein
MVVLSSEDRVRTPLVLLCSSLILASCGRNEEKSVTLYAAQDQEYVQPILEKFTSETGVRVRVVYDSEAVKTVALANRLLAERAHPQCDVFWNNEELRTRQLAGQRVFRETNGWTTFGTRSRRLVINTKLLAPDKAPKGLLELTNTIWKGRVALSYPLFGSTATHFLALRQFWGEAGWQEWCRALARNKPYLLDGNSMVVRHVAKGETWIGLTDSDDVAAAQKEGAPVMALPLTEEFLILPNSVAITRNSPHPANAEKLFQFLQGHAVQEMLQKASALESTYETGSKPPGLEVNWNKLLEELKVGTARLEEIFLR